MFQHKISLDSMFKPLTKLGQKLLRKRINSPSVCTKKLNKHYSDLEEFLEKFNSNSDVKILNLKSLLVCFSNVDTIKNQLLLVLKNRSQNSPQVFLVHLIKFGV